MRDVYNSFARIKYHSLGSNLSFLVSNAFFRLWESLPIEIVSNLTWNPISRTHEFWYSLYRDNLSSIIEQYAKANNLFLSECDHECHCDDCCEDDESVYPNALDTMKTCPIIILLHMIMSEKM